MKTFLPYFACVLAWFAVVPSQAQSEIIPEGDTLWHVVGTTGQSDTVRDVANNILFFVDWTIGEVFTEPLQGSKRRVTPGFHQDWLNISRSTFQFSALDIEGDEQHFAVFPNPVVDDLTVTWDFEEDLILVFEIFCMSGRRMFYRRQNARYAELQIQLDRRSNLIPQFHILRITDPERGFLETHKILKL